MKERKIYYHHPQNQILIAYAGAARIDDDKYLEDFLITDKVKNFGISIEHIQNSLSQDIYLKENYNIQLNVLDGSPDICIQITYLDGDKSSEYLLYGYNERNYFTLSAKKSSISDQENLTISNDFLQIIFTALADEGYYCTENEKELGEKIKFFKNEQIQLKLAQKDLTRLLQQKIYPMLRATSESICNLGSSSLSAHYKIEIEESKLFIRPSKNTLSSKYIFRDLASELAKLGEQFIAIYINGQKSEISQITKTNSLRIVIEPNMIAYLEENRELLQQVEAFNLNNKEQREIAEKISELQKKQQALEVQQNNLNDQLIRSDKPNKIKAQAALDTLKEQLPGDFSNYRFEILADCIHLRPSHLTPPNTTQTQNLTDNLKVIIGPKGFQEQQTWLFVTDKKIVKNPTPLSSNSIFVTPESIHRLIEKKKQNTLLRKRSGDPLEAPKGFAPLFSNSNLNIINNNNPDSLKENKTERITEYKNTNNFNK